MSRRTNTLEDWDDEPDDDDRGDSEPEDGDDDPTVPCPHCGRDVYEDSEQCPGCGRYLSDEDAPPARKSWLIVVGAGISLYIVYRWIVG